MLNANERYGHIIGVKEIHSEMTEDNYTRYYGLVVRSEDDRESDFNVILDEQDNNEIKEVTINHVMPYYQADRWISLGEHWVPIVK